MNNSTIPNLWGDLPEPSLILAPANILKHQAGLLSDITKGMLVGEVKATNNNSNRINFTLIIRVPAMGNYSVKVINVEHGALLYPAILFGLQNGEAYECDDQEQFEENLGAILSSQSVKKLIQGLLSAAMASTS